MLPPLAVQVTAVLALPVTVAVNCLVAPVCRLTVPGVIVTEIREGGGSVDTVTVAKSDLEPSAWLVGVTMKVPAEPGVVYIPDEGTAPPLAVQFTAVLFVPLALAVNCCWPFTCKRAVCGLTLTVVEGGVGIGIGPP